MLVMSAVTFALQLSEPLQLPSEPRTLVAPTVPYAERACVTGFVSSGMKQSVPTRCGGTNVVGGHQQGPRLEQPESREILTSQGVDTGVKP
jgi:hypothetical protein